LYSFFGLTYYVYFGGYFFILRYHTTDGEGNRHESIREFLLPDGIDPVQILLLHAKFSMLESAD
jgi:hypothetical protein